MLQALEAAQPSLKDALSHPGYTNTILVPTDAAWDAALAKYGTYWPVLQALVVAELGTLADRPGIGPAHPTKS